MVRLMLNCQSPSMRQARRWRAEDTRLNSNRARHRALNREFPLAESRSSWDRDGRARERFSRFSRYITSIDRTGSSESQQNVARARHAWYVSDDRELDVRSIAWVFRAQCRSTRGQYSIQGKARSNSCQLFVLVFHAINESCWRMNCRARPRVWMVSPPSSASSSFVGKRPRAYTL